MVLIFMKMVEQICKNVDAKQVQFDFRNLGVPSFNSIDNFHLFFC